MRIFVDVGAHYGETLRVALDPKWGFCRVYALEPASLCLRELNAFRDPRVVIAPIALSNRNGSATLHGAGQLGASLYADKRQPAVDASSALASESIALVRASDWFRENISPGAELYLKLNCEGGEADILEDLLDSGEIHKVAHLYVDFDIRKVPSQAHRQAEIEQRLRSAGVRYLSTENLGKAGSLGVKAWLERCCPPIQTALGARLYHALFLDVPAYERLKAIGRVILPTRLYWKLARKFGRLARSGTASGR